MKAEHFFTQEENERITETIKESESQTDGEIAVILLDSSDRYPEAEILGGVILGSLSALIITDLFLHDSLWSYIPLSFCFFFPFRLLSAGVPRLKSFFLSIKRKEETVKNRALRAFYEKGLYKTRHQTGVLFFLSLFERKVWVLADKGIHTKIDQRTLNRFALTVSKGFKENRAGEALCEAIGGMGRLLAEHFPKTAGDIDELPDEVMTE